MGTIGSFSLGKILRTGMRRNKVIAKVKKKMMLWRDNARLNILQQRTRYQRRVKLNEQSMKIRKTDRPKNLNPTVFSLQPSKKGKLGYTLSTIPEKPKYSDVKPRERLYGMKLKKTSSQR